MGYQLWLSPHTGLRRKGTTFKELETLFIDQITTKFISEPLFSSRKNDNAVEVKSELTKRDFDYVGIIDDQNNLIGYCVRDELKEGSIENYCRPFDLNKIITDSTPLCKLFATLRSNEFAFVMSWDKVDSIVTVWDINKPIVRIYLFGIISLFELHINYWIDYFNPNGTWEKILKNERLAAATKTLELRKGKNDQLTLLECLQLADKKEILRNTPTFLMEFENSKTGIKGFLEYVEILRNELAHSQNSIISNLDWNNFVETVTSIERFLRVSENKLENKLENKNLSS
jgi:hypothetical protein